MRKISRIVISLPLLAAAWMAGTNSMNAAVQELGHSEAVRVLAKSQAIDSKCRYLTRPEHNELQDYVARAEVVAAVHVGAHAATTALHSGTQAGEATDCGRESETVVRATMDAARRAISTKQRQRKSYAAKRKKRRSQKIGSNRRTAEAALLTGSLAKYRSLTAAYYVERRCQHLSHAQAVDFWRRIVRLHNRVLTSQGPDALSVAKAQAIARAKARRRCNSSTARLVRASYQKIRRR